MNHQYKCKRTDIHLQNEKKQYDVVVTLEELFNGFLACVNVYRDTAGLGVSAQLPPQEVILPVPPGSMDGECIELKPFPGNFIKLYQTPHKYYNRHGDHLFLSMKIAFQEALGGFQKTLVTLEGKKIIVSPTPGEVIQDGDIKCVRYIGMPNKENVKGHLYIRFSVEIPTSLDENIAYELAKILVESQKNESENEKTARKQYREVELQDYHGD